MQKKKTEWHELAAQTMSVQELKDKTQQPNNKKQNPKTQIAQPLNRLHIACQPFFFFGFCLTVWTLKAVGLQVVFKHLRELKNTFDQESSPNFSGESEISVKSNRSNCNVFFGDVRNVNETEFYAARIPDKEWKVVFSLNHLILKSSNKPSLMRFFFINIVNIANSFDYTGNCNQ